MNIYEYTAVKNPRGASEIVASYRMRPARDPRGLSAQLAMCVARGGKDALNSVAKAHPDFDLIKSNIEEVTPTTVVVEEKKESFSNACGCSSCSGQSNFSNANGQDLKSDVNSRLKSTSTDTIVNFGFVLIGLVIVLKLIK